MLDGYIRRTGLMERHISLCMVVRLDGQPLPSLPPPFPKLYLSLSYLHHLHPSFSHSVFIPSVFVGFFFCPLYSSPLLPPPPHPPSSTLSLSCLTLIFFSSSTSFVRCCSTLCRGGGGLVDWLLQSSFCAPMALSSFWGWRWAWGGGGGGSSNPAVP